jgi:hypothetical protein
MKRVQNYMILAMTGVFVFLSHGFAQASDCTWQVINEPIYPGARDGIWHDVIKGVCLEPTPGYKLTLYRVNLPGRPGSGFFQDFTLVLDVVAPTETQPQILTPTPVELELGRALPPLDYKVLIWDSVTVVPNRRYP